MANNFPMWIWTGSQTILSSYNIPSHLGKGNNNIKGNITNVSKLIINKITCFHSWCQIIYYVSNYIGTIKITKNTHGKNILEMKLMSEMFNVS